MTATETARAQRAYASNIQATFLGIMTLPVDAMPVRATDKSTEFKLICGECTEGDPVQLTQQYICPNDDKHGPFTVSDAARAKVVDKVLHRVTDDDVSTIKEPTLPSGEVSFEVFDAAEVEAATRPGGAGYRLKPKGAFPLYAMLVDLVSDRSRAFIAEMTLRNSQKLYRAEVWHGQIVLVELVRPGELAPTDEFPTEYDGRLLAKAVELLDVQTGKFDPDAFRNRVRERAAEFDATLVDGKPAPKPKAKAKPKATENDALLAMLDNAVKAASTSKRRK